MTLSPDITFCQRAVPCHMPGSKVQSLVILLHGYGADGHNLLSLGHHWATHLPHTLFLAPHAIASHPAGGGYQWFDLPSGSSGLWAEGLEAAAEQVVRFVWDTMTHYGLTHDRVALVGFSQGAMLALHIGLYRLSLGAIVSYSGLLVPTKRLPQFFPPILLVHGDQDEVLPIETFWQTRHALDEASISYTPLILTNVSHSISVEASDRGCDFLVHHLSQEKRVHSRH